jgi:hypothetical protein
MVKKKLLFPIFIVKLIVLNISFFLSVLLIPIQRQKNLFLSVIVLLIYLMFFGKYLILKQVEEDSPIKLIAVNSDANQIITLKDFSKIKKFEDKMTGLRKISPDNRSVLINLSLISFYQNKIEEYKHLWKQSSKLDPNNPLFINL